MNRGWTRTPSGGDYLVIAGGAASVESELEDAETSGFVVVMLVSYLLFGWLVRLLRWRGRGMVAVRHRDQRWVWITSSPRAAYEVGAAVTDLLQSGGWVPETMPLPVFPGADAR